MAEGIELTKRAQARVGTTVLNKWRLDTLLGVGGMASVYAATHRNGKRAALKILHAEMLISDTLRARFLREGHLANRVQHPGAVSILDDDVADDGSVFLVMELLEGETVEARRVAAGGKLEARDMLLIADGVLDVLIAAHGKDLVHRDLKPANLFVTHDGSIKVLDFGIARLREISTSSDAHITTIASMGTPSFMPPEQARGRWEEVDARSDLWALGATMFTVLTGRFVHEAATVNEQLLAGMTARAPLLRSVREDLPLEVCKLVDRALSFERDARYPTARHMRDAVRHAFETLHGQSISEIRLNSGRYLLPRDADVSGENPTLAAEAVSPTPVLNVAATRDENPHDTKSTARRTPRLVFAAAAIVVLLSLGVVAVRRLAATRSSGAPGTSDLGAGAAQPPVAAGAAQPVAAGAAQSVANAESAAVASPSAVPPPAAIDDSTPTVSHPAGSSAPAAAKLASGGIGTISATPYVKSKPHSTGAPSAAASASVGASVAAASSPAPSASGTVDIFGRRR